MQAQTGIAGGYCRQQDDRAGSKAVRPGLSGVSILPSSLSSKTYCEKARRGASLSRSCKQPKRHAGRSSDSLLTNGSGARDAPSYGTTTMPSRRFSDKRQWHPIAVAVVLAACARHLHAETHKPEAHSSGTVRDSHPVPFSTSGTVFDMCHRSPPSPVVGDSKGMP